MSDTPFRGRLFGPGLPGAGVPAAGRWSYGGSLQVTAEGTAGRQLQADHPAIDAAGFNASSFRISWQGEDGAYAFIIEAETERAICRASAPAASTRHLADAVGVTTRLERRFRFGAVLLILILALPLLGIGLFLGNSDRFADWAVKRISTEHEAQLGDLVLAQTRLQMKIIDRGPAVEAISSIGGRLTTGSVHRYRWFVADRPGINAFAAPGGVVVVYSGLIRAAGSAEEIAGVLTHEVAHAELRHTLRGVIKSLGLRAMVALVIGDISGSVFADAATRLTELRFSRDAEREADAEGLRRLVAARIDPAGMISFYEKLAAEQRLSPPPILSTHPATGERLDALRQEVSRQKGGWQTLPVDIQSIKNSLP
jgi:Zn-dependent protease with chaperone function